MRERFDIFARCEEAYAAAITPASPDHALLSRWAITERTQNVLRLTRREITWGEYNQQADAVQARVAERDRQIATARQQELQVMHNAEMAHRQQAALFMQQQQMMQQRAQQESQRQFQQQMMQQQVINSMNRPVMTNCNRFGNTVNCMSY